MPLKPASCYLGERVGTKTPDETVHRRWDGAHPSEIGQAIWSQGGTILLENVWIDDHPITSARIDDFQEDALVLCFSTDFNKEIAQRLGNKVCCVEIADFDRLIEVIERKFGTVRFGRMAYTASEERSHFIRSTDDAWMAEYRIVVPGIDAPMQIEIPFGIARNLTIF